MDRIVVQVIFERRDVLHGVRPFFFAMNSSRPGDVFVSRGIATAKVVVNEHAETFVIVTQQRIGLDSTSDLQRLTCCLDRQR